MMDKYDSLYLYLKGHTESSTTLSFSGIEKIIGRPLPPEAETRPEWWTNESSKYPHYAQCLAWLQAGYRAFPDFKSRTVSFKRDQRAEGGTTDDGAPRRKSQNAMAGAR